MGLFDIFKKRKSETTFPENELEQSLLNAATDTSAHKQFYQKLIWNQLYVLTAKHNTDQMGIQTMEVDTTVQFVTFENGQIPVFTSKNRIFDKGFIKEEVFYLSLKGQDLFGVAKGATFILNPYSDYAKELIPMEIESLMNGTIYDQIDEHNKELEKQQEFNQLFERATERQKKLIFLDDYKARTLNVVDQRKLEESVKDFQKCIEELPNHWQSRVLMAKAFQRLERHAEALEQLEWAFKIELDNHSIPMEASIEAMHLNDLDKALYYSAESLKRKPNDFALLGNHAMTLLVAKKDNEAKETIEKAIKIKPNDAVNRNVASIVQDVIAGKRKRPTFEDAIK